MFKKQYFPEATLQSLATNNTVYDRGKQLHIQQAVTRVRCDDASRRVTFSVNEDIHDYRVQISFLKNGIAKRYHCTCEAFQTYSGACKHVICSMEHLNHMKKEVDDKSSPHTPNTPSSNSLFTQLLDVVSTQSPNVLSSTKRSNVYVEFVIYADISSFYREFYCCFRVGVDHLYVVRDVAKVVSLLLDGQPYQFGKQFTFNPKYHKLSEADRTVLESLAELLSIAPNKHVNYRIDIPEIYVPLMLEKVSQTDSGFIHFGHSGRKKHKNHHLEPIQITDGLMQFPFKASLIKRGNLFYFKLSRGCSDQAILYFYDRAYMIGIDHQFYTFNAKGYKLIKTVLNIFKEQYHGTLKLRHHELTDFLNYIYPELDAMLPIRLDEDIQRLISKPELTSELYVDYTAETLTVEPVFKYGDISVNPLEHVSLKSSADERIIVRDTQTEHQMLSVLNDQMPKTDIKEGRWAFSDLYQIGTLLHETLPTLEADVDVYVSDSAQRLMYRHPKEKIISVDVHPTSSLLSVTFDLETISPEDWTNIIKQLKCNTSFYKLSSGEVINLKDRMFQQVNSVMETLDIEGDVSEHSFAVPLYKGITLLEQTNIDMSDRFVKLATSLLEPSNDAVAIPSNIKATLRSYQIAGFNWLVTLDRYQLGGILADDMGLGKTLQTITFLQSKVNHQGGKYLIICPSSVLYNWEHEIRTFAPDLYPTIISGDRDERHQLIDTIQSKEGGIWITSYPLIQRDGHLYEKCVFDTVILDESQTIKNASTKTTQAVHKIQSGNVFALSGTPIENRLDELWTIFSIVQPGLFLDKKHFKQRTPQDISTRIKPFILRRLKGQVLDDLPEKIETNEYIELTAEQKRLYQAQLKIIKDDVQTLLESNQLESNRIRVLAGMTRLRQICCHPTLITPDYEGQSAKLERLLEYMQEAKANGKRLVIFSQFTMMLKLIQKALDKQSIDYYYLDGKTPKEERLILTQQFNQGEKDCFLISLKAGGTGLNLTGGDTVILYDSWWNPAVEDQAADRVHRFGQKNVVHVLRLIARGTIEEHIHQLKAQKRELIDSVIHVDDQQDSTRLSTDDILQLLALL